MRQKNCEKNLSSLQLDVICNALSGMRQSERKSCFHAFNLIDLTDNGEDDGTGDFKYD